MTQFSTLPHLSYCITLAELETQKLHLFAEMFVCCIPLRRHVNAIS